MFCEASAVGAGSIVKRLNGVDKRPGVLCRWCNGATRRAPQGGVMVLLGVLCRVV